MLTDTKAPSMRIALHQIWVNIYVEFVVKNPLSPVEHPGGLGVNNELFEASLEQFVVRWTNRLAIPTVRLRYSLNWLLQDRVLNAP
jgi:hypothetical protein